LKCLFVLVLPVQYVGSFCHAVLLGEFVFVQELHCAGKIAFFYQACKLGSLGPICLVAAVNFKDLGREFVDLI